MCSIYQGIFWSNYLYELYITISMIGKDTDNELQSFVNLDVKRGH